MPTSSSLHYAIECFEGLKLYRGFDGRLRLFRPLRNAVRMLDSAKRISLPSFGPEEWVKLVAKLCAVDGPKWLPKERSGHFLCLSNRTIRLTSTFRANVDLDIRPTLISNDPSLSIKRPARALFYIVISCFPTIDEREKGLRLLASQADMVRAWPGGFGHVKLGANYGPSMLAGDEAKKKGFEQVLWLFHNENGIPEVTEAGASNFMLVWRTQEGQMQLVTAPIDRQIILDGITRRSILDLAKERLSINFDDEGGGEKVEILERRLSMDEIVVACEENRIVEAFAVGTSYFVSPVSFIQYGEKALEIPMVEGSTGVYARLFKTWLKVIMYGLEKHDWAYLVESKE